MMARPTTNFTLSLATSGRTASAASIATPVNVQKRVSLPGINAPLR